MHIFISKDSDNDADFQKAYRFGDDELKVRLKDMADQRQAMETENRYKQYILQYEVVMRQENIETSLALAIKAIQNLYSMGDYKDAKEKADELDLRCEAYYRSLIDKFNEAFTAEKLYSLKDAFSLFGTYRDAETYVEKCVERLESWRMKLQSMVQQPDNYQSAREIYEQLTVIPNLFDNPESRELQKKFEEILLVEKLYCNQRNAAIKLIEQYCRENQ